MKKIEKVKEWQSLHPGARQVPGEPSLGYYEIEDKIKELIERVNEIIDLSDEPPKED